MLKMDNPESGEQCYAATEIVEQCKLPVLVKISCQERVESDAELDLSQPLLLYKAYPSVKVQARLLYRHHRLDRTDIFQPYGDVSLVIPKGYTGLFSLLDEYGHSTAKKFMMINDLMKASGRVSSSFLIHNCVVQGFRRISERHYRRVLMASGTILRAIGIFTDQCTFRPRSVTSHSLKESVIKLFGRRPKLYEYGSCDSSDSNGSHSPEDLTQRSYLKCLNSFQEEIYIPLTSAGTFYLISDPGRKKDYNQMCIHSLSTVLLIYKFPCRVKLVCGFLPEIRHHFTGYLQLESQQNATVILACTVQQPPYQLFEVDFTSQFEFQLITPEKGSPSDAKFRTALAFAKAQSESWKRQIKIVHDVTVDAEEEEHIYQEITVKEEPTAHAAVLHGDLNNTIEQDSGVETESTFLRSDSGAKEASDTSTMTYRLSVLSYPSKISFA